MKQLTTSIINETLMEKIHSTTMGTVEAPAEVKISIYDNNKQLIEHLKTKKKFKAKTISTNNFNIYTYISSSKYGKGYETLNIILMPTSDTVEIQMYQTEEEINELKYLGYVDEVNLTHFTLENFTQKQMEILFKLLGLFDSRTEAIRETLVIQNNRFHIPNNFYVNTYGIDFEGSEIITDDISNLQFDEKIEEINLKNVKIQGNKSETAFKLFNNCCYLTTVDITNLQLLPEKEVDISEMFNQCSELVKLSGLPSFLSNHCITKLDATFNNCENIRKIDLGENFDWSDVQSADNLFTDCSSLLEVTLGNIDTAYDIPTQAMFTGVDIQNLEINHIGRFVPELTSSSEQTTLLSIDRITPICNIYTHNAIIDNYETLASCVYSIQNAHSLDNLEFKSYQVIVKMIIDGDIAYEFVTYDNQEELDKLIYKQKILGGHYAIFQGLIALYDDTLSSITILTEF